MKTVKDFYCQASRLFLTEQVNILIIHPDAIGGYIADDFSGLSAREVCNLIIGVAEDMFTAYEAGVKDTISNPNRKSYSNWIEEVRAAVDDMSQGAGKHVKVCIKSANGTYVPISDELINGELM